MKLFIKNNFLLFLVIILWSLFHICFFSINEILKNADSFAYLQMSYYFKNLSLEWFWTWWFWFLYSLFISIFDVFSLSFDEYFSALYLNIFLFWISSILLYKIWEKYLQKKYNLFLVVLFYISSTLINFNITILSENIYIPVFLGLFLFLIKVWKINISVIPAEAGIYKNEKDYLIDPSFKKEDDTIKNIFIISLFLALLYFTRAEAFIYIWSVVIILFFAEIKNYKLQLTNSKLWISLIKKSVLLVTFFLLIIFPYLIHLHSITNEWWLTNKWSSNLRQAELRWRDKMDDEWFEQAVWELTNDSHYLKSWFVWWLAYKEWEKSKSLRNYLLENPYNTIKRITDNQIKLYTKNLPELISWDAIKLFYSKDSSLFYKNYFFYFIFLFPVFFTLFWIYKFFINKNYDFLVIFFSFYITASLFFTLFFVLNRYFIIFLPLFLVFLVYWIQELNKIFINNSIKYIFIFIVLWIYILWNYTYYNTYKLDDDKYKVKKVAWERIKNNLISNPWDINNLKVMERFPITTYYSGTKERWLTPYTDDLEKILEYAKFNKIDIFVVDSLDFKKYRNNLRYMLEDSFKNELLTRLQTFQVKWEKVILYKFNY